MKKLLVFGILVFVVGFSWGRCFACHPVPIWTDVYNSPDNDTDEGDDIAIDGSGNVYVVGMTSRALTGQDIWVRKYNTNGLIQWTTTYSSPGIEKDYALGVAVDSSSNVYVTGETVTAGESLNLWLRKYNTNGLLSWTTTYNGPANGEDLGSDIAVDNSGNVYVTGVTGAAGGDLLIIKYTTNGLLQWTTTYDSGLGQDTGCGISVDNSGSFVYVTGMVTLVDGRYIWLGKYDASDGSPVWTKTYSGGGPHDDSGNDLAVDANYVYVIARIDRSDLGQGYNVWVAKCALGTGDIIDPWPKVYNGPGNGGDGPDDIGVDTSGNVYIIIWEDTPDGSDIMLRKYDNDGNVIWTERYDSPAHDDDAGEDIAVDSQGNMYVVGTVSRPDLGQGRNIWVRKYRDNRNDPGLLWTGETNYSDDGLDPEYGDTERNFIYRVKYKDADNDKPLEGYPKIHILESGVEISGSPFQMDSEGGVDYSGGVIYCFSKYLPLGVNYMYYFEASDKWGASVAANLKSGPTLEYSTQTVVDSPAFINVPIAKGQVGVDIPAGTFSESVDITVKVPPTLPPVAQAGILKSDIGVEITISNPSLQARKQITVTLRYLDTDVVGFDEEKFVVGCYDEEKSHWVVIPSIAYPSENKVVGRTRHLSKFLILQLTTQDDLSNVIAYPNPYKPGSGTIYDDPLIGEGIVFRGLTTRAKIRIFDLAGRFVREMDEDDGDGQHLWDVRNEDGKKVKSGVYLYLITSQDNTGQKSIGRIAIIR